MLERKDPDHFRIKHDHPIRIDISFAKLGDTSLLYFLAPRALRNETDDDEEFEDF